MGARHARVFAALPDLEYVGAYDADAGRADAVAQQFGGQTFTDLDRLIDSVDAVSIAASTSVHAEIALAALDAGRHLFIEKPLAGSLSEARRIVECAERKPQLVLQVGHIERFNPTVRELRRLLAGQFVERATFRRTSPFDGRSLDTDVVHDLMIHDLDLVADLFGEGIAEIDGYGMAVRSEKIDHAVIDLVLDDGREIKLIASRVAREKVRAIELETADAVFHADLLGKSIHIRQRSTPSAATVIHEVSDAEPLRLELEHFAACLQGAHAPLVDVRAGFNAMLTADAIHQLIARSALTERAPALSAAGN
jgi:predicted dehydrogenase